MKVTDIWKPDLEKEALAVYGTTDPHHPGVYYLLNETGRVYISGPLRPVTFPKHADFTNLRRDPRATAALFRKKKWTRIVAFQTRNPMHRAHLEMTLRAMKENDAKLLLHPVVGLTKPKDIDHYTRVRCYSIIMQHYPKDSAVLSLLPLAMRMAGPREAVWHGLIRKNFGCTHFIVGRDHAGPGKRYSGQPYYGEFEAQELFEKYQEEMGIRLVAFKRMEYSPLRQKYITSDEKKPQEETLSLSGTKLREILDHNEPIPEWFTFKQVAQELKTTYAPLKNRGFTVFFTGLSGSGKSTLAHHLMIKLRELGKHHITLLDGDVVRQRLSSELSFSQEHRSLNVRRIGYVASEITKHQGVAICAPIAPYEEDRLANRRLISEYGGYIEVYVNTPLATCEQRDVKGLYARARQNITQHFTGINDPYEPPANPEVTIDSSNTPVSELVEIIVDKIREEGYLPSDPG